MRVLNPAIRQTGSYMCRDRMLRNIGGKGLRALYGLENQTDIDYDIPLHLFSYDGTAYRAQFLVDREMKEKSGKAAPRYPVMTQDNRYEEVYSPDMERRQTTMCEVLDRVENKGIQKGTQKGEDTILSLIRYLLSNNRTDDIKRVTEDEVYRKRLLVEISKAKMSA